MNDYSDFIYTNEAGAIDDLARIILVNHLGWSGSNRSFPSDTSDGAESAVFYGYMRAKYPTRSDYDDADDHERDSVALDARETAARVASAARKVADRRWVDAMDVLGLY